MQSTMVTYEPVTVTGLQINILWAYLKDRVFQKYPQIVQDSELLAIQKLG